MNWHNGIYPHTEELTILYYPFAHRATIQEPQSLVVHVVFDALEGPLSREDRQLTHREDGVWQAKIDMRDRMTRYAAYWFEDPGRRAVDNNQGDYFDVLFCDFDGRRSSASVAAMARSYTGSMRTQGIGRPIDYAKAEQVLEAAIAPDANAYNELGDLWSYKLHIYGDTADGHQKLVKDIDQFIEQNQTNEAALVGTNNFVVHHQELIPDASKEKLWTMIEKLDPKSSPRIFAMVERAQHEKNGTARMAKLREIISRYPDSQDTDWALLTLFMESKDLEELEQLYPRIVALRPADVEARMTLARAYLIANTKLGEAGAKLDEAQKIMDTGRSPTGVWESSGSSVHFSDEYYTLFRARLTVLRSELLFRTGHAKEGLALLEPLRSKMRQSDTFYLLGEEFEATRDYRGALDAYLQAVIRPSNEDQLHNEKLARFWKAHHFGPQKQLEAKISAAETERFKKENYVPKLIASSEPEFDLETLDGKHVTSSSLRGKKAVLTFWAPWCTPCVMELAPLQDYQQQHPEIAVIAAVVPGNADETITRALRQRKVEHMTVAKATEETTNAFGVRGVPHTFVIDEAGTIRVDHLGDMQDLGKHLDADWKAMEESPR